MPNKDTIAYTSPFTLANAEKDSPVLLAFSGGADSSTLLDLLYKDSVENGFSLYVAHFNHKIRGEEAERDMRFCKSVAERYSLPFFSGEADVPALAKESGKSIEMQARECRYAFFEHIMRKHGIKILATAHHANDRLETLLINLLRGSGISGLRSIENRRTFCECFSLVRPLISASREDILDYCEKNSIEYVWDSTNSDESYLRNAIRANIVPKMLELQPALLTLSGRSCEALALDEDFLDTETKKFLFDKFENGFFLETVSSAHKAIMTRALKAYFACFSSAMLEHTHINAIYSLAEKAIPHSSLSLPGGVCAKIEDKKLILSKEEKKEMKDYALFPCDGEKVGEKTVLSPYPDIIIEISKIKGKENFPKGQNILIECDIMSSGCFFRNRREKDVIFCGGMNKKVKKLMCDRKIPIDLRDRLPMLCRGDEILWIPTLAVCDSMKKAKHMEDKEYFLINLKITT